MCCAQAFQAAIQQIQALQACMPILRGPPASSAASPAVCPDPAAQGPFQEMVHPAHRISSQGGTSPAIVPSVLDTPGQHLTTPSANVIGDVEARLHGAMQAMELLLSQQQPLHPGQSAHSDLCPSSSNPLGSLSGLTSSCQHSSQLPQDHHSTQECQCSAASAPSQSLDRRRLNGAKASHFIVQYIEDSSQNKVKK